MPIICPICEAEFIGPRNKKFCSDRCRSLHNTRLYLERNASFSEQEKIRRQNAKALKSIHTVMGDKPFGADTLQRVGFNFQVTTFAPETFSVAFGSYQLVRLQKDQFVISKT